MVNNKKHKSSGPTNNVKLVHDLCSVSDPFCDHAYGAKSPSPSHAATIGYTLKTSGTLTTSTTVPKSVLFFRASTSSQNIYRNQTLTASEFPAETQTNIGVGTHPAFVERARVVSAGIKVWPIYAMTASQGVMSVIPITDDNSLFDGNAHTFADLQSTSGSYLGKMGEFQYNLAPMEEESTFFKPTSNNITVTGDDQDWTSVLIIVDGTATTLYLAWEAIIHYEGIVTSTSGNSIGHISMNDPNTTIVYQYQQKMAHLWGGLIEGSSNRAKRMLTNLAKRVATKAIRAGVAFTANRILPGSGSAVYALTNGIPDVD